MLRGLSVALVLAAGCGEIAAQGSTQRIAEQFRMQLPRFDNRLPGEMADVSFRVWASSGRNDGSRGALGTLAPLTKSTFGLEHGALGLQMAAGYKLSLKVRHGGPSLYLRSQF